jgi:hypothetical protein
MKTNNIIPEERLIMDILSGYKHELTLARASSDYWRTRYIDLYKRMERANALAWFNSIVPLEKAWDRYTCE